jgi:outer membrane protein assembly factor BamB
MSRKLTLALLMLCFIFPVVGQNLGDQSSAGFTNARTYANVDVPDLRPPLRLFDTVELTGVNNATSLAVFEDQFLVGQPGSSLTPVTYKMYSLTGTEIWTQTMGGASPTFRFVPALSHSVVILGGESSTSVKAVSVVDGTMLWGDMAGDTNGRFPALTDNYAIYAGSNKVAARTLAGVGFWEQAVTTAATAIAVRDDSLYFLTHDRALWAVNLVTKTQKWAPIMNVGAGGASLIATEKYVFVNDPADKILAAFNAADGTLAWGPILLEGTFATAPALALAYGRLYVFRTDEGAGNAAVSAYDANTGELIWTITEPGGGLNYAFIADNTVYYYHASEEIRARDAATGALLWSIPQTGVKSLSGGKGELYVLLGNAVQIYASTNEMFMAQLANGGGQTSLIMLANTRSIPVEATVFFYDEDGSPVSVPLRTYGSRSELDVTIPASSSLGIQTQDEGGNLIVGWVHVLSDAPLRGTTDFQFSEDEEITREAGVADSLPIGSGNVFVRVGGAFNSGVAIANPTEQDAFVTLRLLTSAGVELASKSFPLPSAAHLARFINELFEEEVGTAFEGTLVIDSTVPVVITAIRTKDGVQISSYPVGQAVR